jgi:hypothetical protein
MNPRALPQFFRLTLVVAALGLARCATGQRETGDEDGGSFGGDVRAGSSPDVPTFDLVSPFDDTGEADTGAASADKGVVTTDTGVVTTDTGVVTTDTGVVTTDTGVVARDGGTPDVGGCTGGATACGGGCVDLLRDARNCGACGHACGEVEACTVGTCSATCSVPRMLCGSGADTRCVDTQTDTANCGRCGMACAAGSACAAGACATATCMTTASDCNSNAADGCEVLHGTALNTCPAAENLGAFCGDTACGFFCPGRALQTVATRTGNRSRWFRGRLNECSSCPASLNATLTLTVPAGVDYDLYVYSACGRLLGSSQALAGMTDQYTLTGGGSPGSDSADFYVEVRWFSGASCTPWTLTFRARSNSATSC